MTRQTINLFLLAIATFSFCLSLQFQYVGVGASSSGLDPFSPVEENPNYVPPDDSDSDYDTDADTDADADAAEYDVYDEYDEYDHEEDDEKNEKKKTNDNDDSSDLDPKSIMNRALTHTNTTATKLIKFVQKNRSTITVACVIFAFRREIWNTVLTATTRVGGDGKRVLKFHISPTGIMKILVFIDLMMKLQQQQQQHQRDLAGSSPSSNVSVPPGHMGLFGMLMGNLLHPAQSAYVPPIEQHYTFERLNDRYVKDNHALTRAMMMDSQGRMLPGVNSNARNRAKLLGRSLALQKKSGNGKKQNEKSSPSSTSTPTVDFNRTTIVMELKGLDTGVSTMAVIRDQVSFLLNQHQSRRQEVLSSLNITETTSTSTNKNVAVVADSKKKKKRGSVVVDGNDTDTDIDDEDIEAQMPQMEVILVLESPGGSAADYGLAAQQIARLRNEPGVKVTICVDKVAASGGYMMACMASPGCLYAAPFAIVGSIGVIGQTLNIHKSLQNWGVQPLVFRGGKDKAPVGLVGEVTKEGLAKVQDMVDKTHRAFKNHVANARPVMKDTIDEVATGDVWLGIDAVEIGLVDKLITSDDYIQERILSGEKVLKLLRFQRPRFAFGGPPRQGIPGLFHSSLCSISDTITEFSSLLKRVNGALEDAQIPSSSQHIDLSKIATAHATGIKNVQTSL